MAKSADRPMTPLHTPDTMTIEVPCENCDGSRSGKRQCRECDGRGVVAKNVPANEVPFDYLTRPTIPVTNPNLAGLPGRTRQEKRANARAAQRAFVLDRRARQDQP